MKKAYSGSCHCGAVRFEAALDLDQQTSKCNCSVCAKARFWKQVVPPEAVRVLQGEAALTEYRFGSGNIQHLFCSHCGIKPFGRGEVEGFGRFVAVNLACLDDAGDAALAAAPVQFEDGRNNDWSHPPAETRYL
jgi:hypothetical protein